MSNVIEARAISITDEEIFRISGDVGRGQILENSFSWEKIGGLREFNLKLSRETEVPLFSGMRWEFYFKDAVFLQSKKFFTGYSEIIPTPDSDSPTINISGKGYYWKLKEKILNESYSAEPISNIINSLDFTGTDLDITKFNIAAPSDTITIDFEDKTYIQVLDELLKASNTLFKTVQYIWGVDENRGLYFYQLPSTGEDVNKKFFEGYQFQSPEVEVSDKVINKLLVFRATLADPKATEFVATYQDTDSQGKYGIRESKLTLSDYADTTTVEKIADAFLSEHSEPDTIISINDFYVKDIEVINNNLTVDETGPVNNNLTVDETGPVNNNLTVREAVVDESQIQRILTPDYYGISTKPQIKYTLVNEFDSLTGWTENTGNSTVSVINTNVFTGRAAFKWERVPIANGDYIELDLNTIITSPIEARINLYYENNVSGLLLTLIDSNDQELEVVINETNQNLKDTWLTYSIKLPNSLVDENLQVDPGSEQLQVDPGSEDMEVSIYLNEDGLVFGNLITDVKKVKITLLDGVDSTDIIYLDRLDIKNKSWGYHRLTLERAEYNVQRNFILGNMEFGDTKDNLVDEIKNKLDKGDVVFDIVSKQ